MARLEGRADDRARAGPARPPPANWLIRIGRRGAVGTASASGEQKPTLYFQFVRALAPAPVAGCRQHHSTPRRRRRAAAPQADETALDRYVAAPDAHFAFTKVGNLPASGGVTATILELTSQQWLTAADVDRPLWKHWLVVYRPEKVTSDIGLLWIGGGANNGKLPSRSNAVLAGPGARHGHGDGRIAHDPQSGAHACWATRNASRARKTT